MTNRLPSAFSDLEQWVDAWALSCEEDRFRKLHAVSYEELADFYGAMQARLPAVLDYLSGFKLSGMPADALTLFHLAMTMAETSHPMELGWGASSKPLRRTA